MTSKKPIPIVYAVLNFLADDLSDPYNLTSDEKLLLIFLAKFSGTKGIYPSIKTLAKQLKRDYRNMRRSLKKLSDKKLITIDHQPGKSSHYLLMIPDLELSTTQGADALSNQQTVRAPTPSHPGHARPHTQGADAPRIYINNNLTNKSERGRKKRAFPLPPDFLANKETILVAQEGGLSEDEANNEFVKFMNYYTANQAEKYDWQAMLQLWFNRACTHKRKESQKKPRNEPKDTVRSTVPFFKPEPESYQACSPEAAQVALKDIMARLRHGGSPNGLGRERERKKETG